MQLRFRSLSVAVIGVAAFAVAGCGSGSDNGGGAGSGAASGGIRVTDVWARTSPMEARNGAVYARIRNTADRPDALVGASVPSSVAATVELHETVMSDRGDDDSHGGGMDGNGMHGNGMDGNGMDGEGGSGGTDDADGSRHGALGVRTVAVRPADHDGGGGMQMRPVDRITIPADGTRVLKPGGYHIMLLDLAGALKVGESFPVTLRFERAGTIKVTAEVRR